MLGAWRHSFSYRSLCSKDKSECGRSSHAPPGSCAFIKRGAVKQLLSAPNQLTLLRMAFLPFIVIKLVEGHYGWALALFIFAGLSDGLDGLLARTLKQQTVLGQSGPHCRQASAQHDVP